MLGACGHQEYIRKDSNILEISFGWNCQSNASQHQQSFIINRAVHKPRTEDILNYSLPTFLYSFERDAVSREQDFTTSLVTDSFDQTMLLINRVSFLTLVYIYRINIEQRQLASSEFSRQVSRVLIEIPTHNNEVFSCTYWHRHTYVCTCMC